MKLTKQTLKRIIKEEINNVISEANIFPDPSRMNLPSDDQINKIIRMIDSGEEKI